MAVFRVEGGHRLKGELVPQGAKNEALQILSAVLLTPERVVVHNVPDILDVMKLVEMLGDLGVVVEELGEAAAEAAAGATAPAAAGGGGETGGGAGGGGSGASRFRGCPRQPCRRSRRRPPHLPLIRLHCPQHQS